MKITVYYEDNRDRTTIEVPDEDCEIWVENDYQQRLAAVQKDLFKAVPSCSLFRLSEVAPVLCGAVIYAEGSGGLLQEGADSDLRSYAPADLDLRVFDLFGFFPGKTCFAPA